MVAQTINSAIPRGARPLDPVRDIYPIARLLEEAFRADRTFPLAGSPFLRELGIFLWALNYMQAFPPTMTGFVWVEDGRVVGNVTLTQEEGHADRFMISNVAVKTEYRGQGIARALMVIVLDYLRERGIKTAILNVRPNNPGAIKLYTSLGFHSIEMRGEWVLPPSPALPPLEQAKGEVGEVRPLRSSDNSAVTEILRAVIPTNVEVYRARQNEFALSFEDSIAEWLGDLFTGRATQRWALERNERLAALILTRGQSIASRHSIAIQVHPRFRGQVENDLIAFALHTLARFPARAIRAVATDAHPELIAALEQQGFQFVNGLTLMAMSLA